MVSRSQRAIRRDKWVSDLGVATQNHNFTEAHLIPDDDGDADGDASMVMMLLMMAMMITITKLLIYHKHILASIN